MFCFEIHDSEPVVFDEGWILLTCKVVRTHEYLCFIMFNLTFLKRMSVLSWDMNLNNIQV